MCARRVLVGWGSHPASSLSVQSATHVSTIIEKMEHGYVVRHHEHSEVASAEHVANLILHHWPDVTEWIKLKLGVDTLLKKDGKA